MIWSHLVVLLELKTKQTGFGQNVNAETKAQLQFLGLNNLGMILVILYCVA